MSSQAQTTEPSAQDLQPSVVIDPLHEPVFLVPIRPRAPWQLVGRVFGYLLMTIVWLAVWFIAVFGTLFVAPGMLGSDALSEAPIMTHGDLWLFLLWMVLAVPPLFGMLSAIVLIAPIGMVLGSATLLARSLNARYRHEQLSFTTLVTGEATGRARTAALSLMPVRLTRWTKIILMFQFSGFLLNGQTMRLGIIWGYLYLFTLTWVWWPATGAAVFFCGAITAALAYLLVSRAWKHRHGFAHVMPRAFRGTVYENSWPATPRVVADRWARKRRPRSIPDLREPVYLLDPERRAVSTRTAMWRPLGYLVLSAWWTIAALASLALTVFSTLPPQLLRDDVSPLSETRLDDVVRRGGCDLRRPSDRSRLGMALRRLALHHRRSHADERDAFRAQPAPGIQA